MFEFFYKKFVVIRKIFKIKKFFKYYWIILIVVDFLVILFIFLYFISQPPSEFPINTPITIEKGTSVREITSILGNENVVHSEILLYLTLLYFYDPAEIKASTYIFESRINTFEVARKLIVGEFNNNLLRITFPEGFTVSQYPFFVPKSLGVIDLEKLYSKEGYLFPDTYFIPKNYTNEDIILLLENTFIKKISPFKSQIEESVFSFEEIIIFASIIEREAGGEESKKMISGILKNRLDIDMPLQVDASVAYGLKKSGADLSRTDLKIDTPFNTYTRKGLPPSPISNPGLASIEAVLNPIESDYFYYITGSDGNFYYAKTLSEHNINVARQLR